MSSLQQDTYTSSEEEDYVFEESSETVQPVEKVQPVKKKIEKSTEEEVENGFSFDLDENENEVENEAEDESSESEYEEIIVRKKVKKKSSKKRRSQKESVQKETNLDGEENIANMSHLANFINQFEGVDPFNFQVVAPGQ